MQGRRRLSHLDREGRARMVDVSGKAVTVREAVARGEVKMEAATLRLLSRGKAPKGDVLAVARIAGILAAKKTHELVPLCHPLPIDSVTVELEADKSRRCVRIEATVRTEARTGVEMEALTAVAVAGLTVYDMMKAVDRAMSLGRIRLVTKRGGRSGEWKRRGERK